MPQVLTTNAQILCPHGGKGVSTPTMPVWSVNGGYVLLEGDPGVLSCPFIVPCGGYTLRSMGLNATTINGRKVILVTDFNQTFTGLPLAMIETHPVQDNTSPAPLPSAPSTSGGSSGSPDSSGNIEEPPLPPELMDMVKPIVIVAPPVLAFNSTTMLPPTAMATFTLSSAFPMQWVLTLINGVARVNLDVTKGLPPGLTVAPPGGKWGSPSLTVVITLTAPYMASLGIGTHDFYMTGVSKRGLSGYAMISLTVS